LLLHLGLNLDIEVLASGLVHSGVVRLRLLLSSDLSEHSWVLVELRAKRDASVLASDLSSASLDDCSVEELVLTFFDDHVRDGLSGVYEVKVGPLLDLPFERLSGDILDSDGHWMLTIV